MTPSSPPLARPILLAALLVATAGCRPPEPAAPTNVLFVVVDTTRADEFQAVLGQGGSATRKLVEDGVFFTRARSTSAWTLPAHASMFTALYPSRHGAHHESQLLRPELETLAELLGPEFDRAGFSENPHIGDRKGFAQGFDSFEETWREVPAGGEPVTIERALEWLGARPPDRPFLLFVNLMDPHLPYAPPDDLARANAPPGATGAEIDRMRTFGEREARAFVAGRLSLGEDELALLRGLYRAEVARVELRLGRLLDALEETGRLDDTLVVVVGDHGENIGEHGLLEHQLCLYETLLRVPLVLRLPGVFDGGERRDAPAQLVDLTPTILDVLGIVRDEAAAFEGTSLLDGGPPAERPVIAEYMRPLRQKARFERIAPEFDFSRFDHRLRSFQVGSLKLIHSEGGAHQLFDLARDPAESTNLADDRPEVVARLTAALADWLAHRKPAPLLEDPELDEETLRALRGLGYLD